MPRARVLQQMAPKAGDPPHSPQRANAGRNIVETLCESTDFGQISLTDARRFSGSLVPRLSGGEQVPPAFGHDLGNAIDDFDGCVVVDCVRRYGFWMPS